ncbi:MAG: acyl-CoA reductase [Saprospiraceae bacterium]|nr:acyl-CoA reductase [Saprospiraceae bacterium]
MTEKKIAALAQLSDSLHSENDEYREVVLEAGRYNPWFTPRQVDQAVENIRKMMLDTDQLRQWISGYNLPSMVSAPRKVGLVMAGNIPLVGFHDFLSVWLSGHQSLIKCSEKDARLLPYLLDQLLKINPEFNGDWQLVDRLTGFNAVIATGSDNSARYFQAYFGAYPHIIRKNRNGLAVLTGNETEAQLRALALDMLTYFGLGCRNVSKILIPVGYDFEPLLAVLEDYPELQEHNRYRNNFDYQYALLIMNQEKHYTRGQLLFRESPSLLSPMATIHYEEYRDMDEVQAILQRDMDHIQCVISGLPMSGIADFPFGASQCPGLSDYADGVDVMAFLTQLHHHA